MPIYEYDCRECGRRFEELVRSGELEKRFSVFAAKGTAPPPAPA